jgi:hypothetical protein
MTESPDKPGNGDTDDPVTPTPSPEPQAPTPPSPPPAVSAAARARRIGGRVGPRATPDPTVNAAEAPVPAVDGAPGPAVRLDKPTTWRTVRRSDALAEDDATPRVVAVVPGWLRWLPAEILTAGAVTMAVLMIVFSHGVWWGKTSGNAVREEILAATKTCVAKTNTYKYTELAKYSTAVKECTTGRLTGQINKTISGVIKKYAPTLKATQTAQISRGAIEAVSQDGKQWTVIVFGQLSVVNTNDPKGRTDPFAAQVKMEKVHGKWLMSGLSTVATPVG